MMRGSRIIAGILAGGAFMLPLLAYGHGAGFLDARYEMRDGKVRLRIVADYGANPTIADEAEARKVLADALRIEIGSSGKPRRLDELAPLRFVERNMPDAASPMPGHDDPNQQHQLLAAYWRWSAPAGEIRFHVPETSKQTVLFWMKEPDVSPPRWSMLVPGESTPSIMVKGPERKPAWIWGGMAAVMVVISIYLFRSRRKRRHVSGFETT